MLVRIKLLSERILLDQSILAKNLRISINKLIN